MLASSPWVKKAFQSFWALWDFYLPIYTYSLNDKRTWTFWGDTRVCVQCPSLIVLTRDWIALPCKRGKPEGLNHPWMIGKCSGFH